MERGFLSQKGSWGRGVKEKVVSALNLEVVKDGVVPSVTVAYYNTQKDLYSDIVAMEVQNPLVDQTNAIDVVVSMESIQDISERFKNTAYGFFLGKRVTYLVLYGWFELKLENGLWFIRNHPLILRKWNPDVDLLKEDVGNVPVQVKLHGVPITVFSEDGLSAISTKLGTPLMLDSYTYDMCLQSWGKSSYARVMIELQADVELKDTIVVFGHTQEERPKNIGLGVAKNLKKPSQTSQGVMVGLKVGFKPHKEYRPVPKKPTANSSGNKKKAILVDEADNPLKKVECLGDYDSEDEVALVDNDMAYSLASERVGFGTQSQALPQEIQAICDNLVIQVRGRKKK
ncbi:RNA-directed DNA polymerase, eukaryota, reverse transcriptase zinc-binding domain protein [Tanacetum coccineum]